VKPAPDTLVDGLRWNASYNEIKILLENPTDTDYSGFDGLIFGDAHIGGAEVLNNRSCQIGAEDPRNQRVTDSSGMSIWNVQIIAPGAAIFVPRYQIRCDKIYKKSVISISVVFSGTYPQRKPVRDDWPSKIRVVGSYTARYRQEKIDEMIILWTR